MAKKNWIIKIEDGLHKIELEHGYFTGKRIIYLDGKIIELIDHNYLDVGSKHEFEINGHYCVILITVGFNFSYDLIVDGISEKTKLPFNLDNIHFKKPINILSHGIGAGIASIIWGYITGWGVSFAASLLITISIAYFGIKRLNSFIRKSH